MRELTDRQVADRYLDALDDIKAARRAPAEVRERAFYASLTWEAEVSRRGIHALLWD